MFITLDFITMVLQKYRHSRNQSFNLECIIAMVEPFWVFDVSPFEIKNRVFEFNYQKMNTFEFVINVPNMMFESVFNE